MKNINNPKFDHPKSFLCLISIFLLMMTTGCSDTAVETLQKKKIAASVDSLCIYSSKGDLETVKLLIDAGVDIYARSSLGSRPLIDASWAGKQDVVLYLLDSKADVNGTNSGGLTALSAAIKHEQVALLLLDRGANPNVVDPTGSSPLIESAWLGNVPLVKALLAKGAVPNYRRSSDGMTAMKIAVLAKKADIIQILKAAGATE
jgi:ankyrin repeat protein